MTIAAILLAAGAGTRLGGEVPKAFADLDGRTLLEHALATTAACSRIDHIVVAVPPPWRGRAEALVQGVWSASDRPGATSVVDGGETRQASVAAALAGLHGSVRTVVCHDVARPLATVALFEAVLDGLDDADGVVPAVPVVDTIKIVDDGQVQETLDRRRLAAVQTPQAFDVDALREAHERARSEAVEATDDAALLERIGKRVAIVPGERTNLKITTDDDLRVAAAFAG